MIKLIEREPHESCQGYALEGWIEGQKYESKSLRKFDSAFRKYAKSFTPLMIQDMGSKEYAKYNYFYAPVFTIDMSMYNKSIRVKLDSYADRDGAGLGKMARVWEIEMQVFNYDTSEKLSNTLIKALDASKAVMSFVKSLESMKSTWEIIK